MPATYQAMKGGATRTQILGRGNSAGLNHPDRAVIDAYRSPMESQSVMNSSISLGLPLGPAASYPLWLSLRRGRDNCTRAQARPAAFNFFVPFCSNRALFIAFLCLLA